MVVVSKNVQICNINLYKLYVYYSNIVIKLWHYHDPIFLFFRKYNSLSICLFKIKLLFVGWVIDICTKLTKIIYEIRIYIYTLEFIVIIFFLLFILGENKSNILPGIAYSDSSDSDGDTSPSSSQCSIGKTYLFVKPKLSLWQSGVIYLFIFVFVVGK